MSIENGDDDEHDLRNLFGANIEVVSYKRSLRQNETAGLIEKETFNFAQMRQSAKIIYIIIISFTSLRLCVR